MKMLSLVFAALALLFACNPENNQDNPDNLTVTGDALDIADVSATFTGYANLPLEFGDAQVGIVYDRIQSFGDAVKLVATGLDGNNMFSVTATGLTKSTTYYFKSFVQNGMAIKYGAVKSFTTTEYPAGAVDLGIVMKREDGTTYKLFWAKSNLSRGGLCANPEDFGDYYSWGEMEPKAGYGWDNYKFTPKSSNQLSKYNTDSKYGTVDNKTVLEPEDDAAYKILRGRWRMPTADEWKAIMEQCTWVWTTQNGVGGRLVTAKNGNSIFLPAAGHMADAKLYDEGVWGDYWASSLNTDDPRKAWRVSLDAEQVFSDPRVYRASGWSIRPVAE